MALVKSKQMPQPNLKIVDTISELERDAESIEYYLRSKGLNVNVNKLPMAQGEGGGNLVGRIKICIRGADVEEPIGKSQLKAIMSSEDSGKETKAEEMSKALASQKSSRALASSALKSSSAMTSSSSQMTSSVRTRVVKSTQVVKTTRTVRSVKVA